MCSITKLTVGLIYNLKKNISLKNEDDEAEYDDWNTINKIKTALERTGYEVYLLEATSKIINSIQTKKIDIVFNIAEGKNGRGREAQIPALLSFLSIPYTGSDETTLSIALDKALAKKIVAYDGIRTPGFQLFFSKQDRLTNHLDFPLIVKPNAEGSSKGIIDTSIAINKEELYPLVERIISKYHQPALVEEYIDGRELTVGILGNGENIEILPIMEINFKNTNKQNICSYQIKKNFKEFVSRTCPAHLSELEEKTIKKFAYTIFHSLGCKDMARIDLRISKKDNQPYFLEINPLPGLSDDHSDLPFMAKVKGIKYEDLINRILNEALKRYNIATL